MDWRLLFPTTLNPFSAWHAIRHESGEKASQALTDLFINANLYLVAIFLIWSLYVTLRSIHRSYRYRGALKGVTDYASAKNRLHQDERVPLFRGLHHHLVDIPSRDGSHRTELRRTVDAAEIFTDVELAPGLSTNRLLQALPGILTGLGVLGTFVGLQLGLGGIIGANTDKLSEQIPILIQGCSVAFATSVWGVITSLGFSFVEKLMEAFAVGSVRKLQSRVDNLIHRYVPEDAMAELERSSRGSEDLLKGLAVAIGNAMQEAMGKLGSQIRDAVASATMEGQGTMAEQSAKILSESLTAELETIRKSVEGFQPEVKALSETVNGAQKVVINAVDKLNAHEEVMLQMRATSVEWTNATNAMLTLRESLEVSAMRNQEAAKAQEEAAKVNEDVAEKFQIVGERLPEIRQTLEQAASIVGSIHAPVMSLKEVLDSLPGVMNQNQERQQTQAQQRDETLLKLTSDLAAKVTSAAQEFSKVEELATKLGTASSSLEEASSELAVFGHQILQASQEQRASSEASRLAASAHEKVTAALEPLPASLATVTSGLAAAGSSVKEGANSASASYAHLIDLQKVWFDGASLGLNSMKDKLQQIMKDYGSQIEGQTKRLFDDWTEAVTECLKSYTVQVETLEGGLEELQAAISRLN
ncbi:MAG: anti-phage ZorAB system protein ZorA [Prosthecobacter sp.]